MYIHTRSVYDHHIYILKIYICHVYIYDMYIHDIYIHDMYSNVNRVNNTFGISYRVLKLVDSIMSSK